MILVKNSQSETIEKGLDKLILEYFNVVSVDVTCVDTSNGDVEVTNTSSLDVGTHNIKCTVTEDEETVSANKTLIVEISKRELTEKMMEAEVGSNDSIRKDNLGNPRYAGSNPNNYACFGTQNETCDSNHLYRIIGIIDGKVKIIKNSFYKDSNGNINIAWDTSNSNNWDRPADLKTELNRTSFYGNTSYIDEVSKSYIAKGTWYTGGINNTKTLGSFEDAKRSLTSTGYVGLMSVTDFGYASNNKSCERATDLTIAYNACSNNNYLYSDSTQEWTITPNNIHLGYVWFVRTHGFAYNNSTTDIYGVRPSLFLKSEVKIISGTGTKTEPYRLSM